MSLLIDLEDAYDTNEILQSLRKKETDDRAVSKLKIEYWGEESLTEDQLTPAFAALNGLSELKQLRINLGDHGENKLPVELLARAIQSIHGLSVLCLDSITLTGQTEEFAALAYAVEGHLTLSCVCLSMITAYNEGERRHDLGGNEEEKVNTTAVCLQPLLVSLANLPTMRVLELDEVPTSKAALESICQSKYIQELELWNLPAVNDHIISLVSLLKQNVTLTKLEICSCQLSSDAGYLLVDMLQKNKFLQSIVLEVEWGSTMFGRPIAAILQGNQALTNLHMICVQSGHIRSSPEANCSAEAYASAICSGLESNHSLQRLTIEFQQSRIFCNDNSRLLQAFSKPLLKALERNHTLQQFALTGGRCNAPLTWGPSICFLMQLNQAGRSRWPHTEHKYHSMMQHLLSVHEEHDLSTLFYFLSLHPHLLW